MEREITKYRQPSEWTAIIIKYVTKSEELTKTDKLFAEKLLSNCEVEAKKEVSTEKEQFWKQLNKYWLYLSTLDEA